MIDPARLSTALLRIVMFSALLGATVYAQPPPRPMAFEHEGAHLVGELWLPDGPGRYPVAVVVHGSEDISAISAYRWLRPLLDYGVGLLVFDKRGTGGSDGTYTQSHQVLADDVNAAVSAARRMDGVDPGAVGLLAFSQGGWIAPIAAAADPRIRFVVIDSGPAVSPSEEDIWSTLAPLRQAGAGAQAIAEAATLVRTVHRIIESRFAEGWADFSRCVAASEDRDWYASVAASDSNSGFFLSHELSELLEIADQMGLREAEADYSMFYDPTATISAVPAPMLWLFGERDASMPAALSIERLGTVARETPDAVIQIQAFPALGHGVLPALLSDPGSADAVQRIAGFMTP
jgi:uncharacterized protein